MNKKFKILISLFITILIYLYFFGFKRCASLVYNTLNFLNNILLDFNGTTILSTIFTSRITYILVGGFMSYFTIRNLNYIGKFLYKLLYYPISSIMNVLSNFVFKK